MKLMINDSLFPVVSPKRQSYESVSQTYDSYWQGRQLRDWEGPQSRFCCSRASVGFRTSPGSYRVGMRNIFFSCHHVAKLPFVIQEPSTQPTGEPIDQPPTKQANNIITILFVRLVTHPALLIAETQSRSSTWWPTRDSWPISSRIWAALPPRLWNTSVMRSSTPARARHQI